MPFASTVPSVRPFVDHQREQLLDHQREIANGMPTVKGHRIGVGVDAQNEVAFVEDLLFTTLIVAVDAIAERCVRCAGSGVLDNSRAATSTACWSA